ncbi:MAG: hypothetical protein ACWA6Y_06615 [Polaromonas sp.]
MTLPMKNGQAVTSTWIRPLFFAFACPPFLIIASAAWQSSPALYEAMDRHAALAMTGSLFLAPVKDKHQA